MNEVQVMDEKQTKIELIKDRFVEGWLRNIDVDEGWYQIVIDCDKELSEIDPKYEIYQIKQKFGALRYYTRITQPFNEQIYLKATSIVNKYESISKVTCEATGLPGVLMKSKGLYRTLNPSWCATSETFKNYKIVDTSDFEVLQDRQDREDRDFN